MVEHDEPTESSAGKGTNSLSPEQWDTAKLIDQLLGKALSDRYIDFCRLSAGDFDLRVSSPVASHALRELDSILRATLAAPLDAKNERGVDKEQLKRIETALMGLNCTPEAIDRAKAALAPRINHAEQIKKIVTRLGLDSNGDIAQNWLSVREAASKAHERPFNRELKVDDEFRERWAKPFDSVVRGVVVALQGHYSALAKRVEFLATMDDTTKAIALFASEIPGALPLQWLFFKKINGARWLPELIKRNLILPPLEREGDDEGNGIRFREWPVSAYLLTVAKSECEADRALVAKALRDLKSSKHPDLRRDGLEILSALPGKEAAEMSDVAEEWLMDENSLVFGAFHAEAMLKHIAEAGDKTAALRIAKAMLYLYGSSNEIRSHYASQMYQHSLPKIANILTKVAGLDALRLLVELLYEAGVLDGKIKDSPPVDYTSVILGPLSSGDRTYQIFGALVNAVSATAVDLIMQPNAPAEETISLLASYKQRIFRRLAYYVLSHNPQEAPDLSDRLLLERDAIDSMFLRYEYGSLAKARYPSMSVEKQAALFELIDSLPEKHNAGWRLRFEEHHKRQPNDGEVLHYRLAIYRDAVWEWKDVLPADRKRALDDAVAKVQDPDAWRRRMEVGDQSPMSPDDFRARTTVEVAEYLRTWKPDTANRETKTVLAFELYKAVQAETDKFAAGAMDFEGLAPIYIRRFFEGIRMPAQNRAKFDWTNPLQLLEATLPLVLPPTSGEASLAGDDPSWHWASLEGAQLLKTGLQQGGDGIGYENAELVHRLVVDLRNIVPQDPETDAFEERYNESPFFASEQTMLGLSVELCILELFWLSKIDDSYVAKNPHEALTNSPDFKKFADWALSQAGANGRIVRAIMGRYLDHLFYFGSTWVEANFDRIFPEDDALRAAAWLAHLINGRGPILPLMPHMRNLYAEETEQLSVPLAHGEREWRHNAFSEYVVLHLLFGQYPIELLDRFFFTAPQSMRQHFMWFLGRQMHKGQIPESATKRGMDFVESRLRAVEGSDQKDAFISELGSIASWLHDTDLEPSWLIGVMLRMLRAGIAPSQAFNVVEYASDVAEVEPADAVKLIRDLFAHPRTEPWVWSTNQEAVREVIQAGIKLGDAETRANVERIISFLVSRGETAFLDLSGSGSA